MRYVCLSCGKEFDEPIENKEIKSRLVRVNILKCTHCNSHSTTLSEQGKLLVERKAKIDKIENNQG
jgi:DNA-directed RNA polymerase subunit RPC12/RpoP